MPRRILLAGASSGIGLALAHRLAGDGHRLALLARRRAALAELARALPGGDERHAAVPADVLDPRAVEAAISEAEARLGPVDTLVYSAGSAVFLPIEETTGEVWSEMMGANLTGLFHVVRAVVPRFRLLGHGHIAAILSIASRQAFGGSTAYTAAKFGARGFMESLRAELRPFAITVTVVLPGATDTPLWDRLGPGWDRSRMMKPDEVARVVAASLLESGNGVVEEIRLGPAGGAL